MRKFTSKTILVEIISALLVLLFVYAGVNKLLGHTVFLIQLTKFPLLRGQRALVAWAVPVAELIIATLLLFHKTRLRGLYFSCILLSLFTVFLIAMILLSPNLPCKCGGVISKMSWPQHVLFNIFFVGISVSAIRVMKSITTYEVKTVFNQANAIGV